MQKVKLISIADVLEGLYEMGKLRQFLLFLFHINHLGIRQFVIQRQHFKKFLFERANSLFGRWWSLSPKFIGEALTVTLMEVKI